MRAKGVLMESMMSTPVLLGFPCFNLSQVRRWVLPRRHCGHFIPRASEAFCSYTPDSSKNGFLYA